MPFNLPRIVMAALRGGSGKTTLTLGLIQALTKAGLSVAPFKKGPDYIDPFWHSEAAGSPCRNLDPYMMGREQVERSFAWHGRGFDAAVVEGNRGLFDGMDADGSHSTAQLAKWLKSPLLLAVDCSMTSRTVAAVVLGCQRFEPDLNLAGVVLNPVANSRQENLIRDTIERYTGLPVLGAVPRLTLDMPQRHMGLVPPQEHATVSHSLAQAADSVAQYVDVQGILALMRAAEPLAETAPPRGLFPEEGQAVAGRPRVAVLRDAAFGFYYQENLEALANHGAELVFCSALEDPALPPAEALYIGGGFPETHAAALAANEGFRQSLLKASQADLPIYAECGGLMYLGRRLVVDGQAHEMAGVFPMDFVMREKPAGHGYTLCRVQGDNPFLPLGLEFKAHEFHYSHPEIGHGDSLSFVYEVLRGKGIVGRGGGLLENRTLGTYHHVHALGAPQWARGLVRAAAARQLKQRG